MAGERNIPRSIGAVITGFAAVVLLSLGADEILHLTHFYPPWDRPMVDPAQNAVALAYRIVFTMIGGAVTARLAPRHPMRHVIVLGIIGLMMGLLGVFATSGMNLGPRWYPIAIAVTGFPATWLGGFLFAGRYTKR